MRPELSQVFLLDRDVIENIASALPLHGKTVLEIGAGEGVLTKALSKKVGVRGKVVALEIDRSLSEKIGKSLAGAKNVEVNFVDALDFNYTPYKTIFGNLPYHISSKILFRILESPFEKAVLCLQKEFALRLVAKPGEDDYSRLSVMAQNLCDVKVLFEIPRFSFVPMPEVDSAVVLLEANKKHELNGFLIALVFQHKNQNIRKALMHSRHSLGMGKKSLALMLKDLPFSEKCAKGLSLEDFSKLGEWFEKTFSSGAKSRKRR
ncbi:TPA: ribosomal RNA small subunit methyltransferase A [Candidatus Micrarchaeota archaeon]|nr:ribosomal RNA small subunit methyltransferase A [Candidatus Micrarchaeota archaeon]